MLATTSGTWAVATRVSPGSSGSTVVVVVEDVDVVVVEVV
jgi:hypothetical protein